MIGDERAQVAGRKSSTYNMSDRLATVNILFHDAILVDTDRGQHVQGVFVAGLDTVENQTDHNLLPGRASLVPELRLLQIDDIADILHHTVQGSGSQHLVFVVVGNGDQQLGVSVVDGRAQVVSVPQGEFVGVTSRRGIWSRLAQRSFF